MTFKRGDKVRFKHSEEVGILLATPLESYGYAKVDIGEAPIYAFVTLSNLEKIEPIQERFENMDIQIKRKPIDKKAEVIVAIDKYVNGPTRSINETIETIDAIYNSKEKGDIEEAVFQRKGTDLITLKATTGKYNYVSIENTSDYISINKEELSEYIMILSQIQNQMK